MPCYMTGSAQGDIEPMVNGKEKCCRNCRYWRDYTQRVFALIEGKTKNTSRGDELRRCKFRPAPGADNDRQYYTSEDWFCNEYTT